MRISWNWLSELVDISGIKKPETLAELLTNRGLEVEGIERQDKGFDHVITAQILSFVRHPQADRLNVCQVSLGSGDPLEIVCGASNVAQGAKVVLAQVGAHLPNDIKITANKIRGVVSNGMLCSAEELRLATSSEGIIILPPETPLGVPYAKVLGRNDTIFSLKLTANRGDCLSHLGIAREVAAALGGKVKVPEIEKIHYGKSPISIHLDAEELAPQFYGCWIEGVKIGPSPEWVVKRLEAVGSRSINNVVDATNLALFEFGYPVHAYDAKQIAGNEIHVREARFGEELPLLDGSKITLNGTELVIADRDRAISLAGIMGGGNSEVQESTTSVYLEVAEFHPTKVRRASTAHQKKTEGAHRFERGVDPQGPPNAIGRLAKLILTLAGGKITGASFVQHSSRGPNAAIAKREIQFDKYYIHDFLGFDREHATLTLDKIKSILESLNCKAELKNDLWTVHPPSYRLDLTLRVDFAEEVARCFGYDQIPSTIPPLTSSPVFKSSSSGERDLIAIAKDALVRNGILETVNFAFTSKEWLSRCYIDSAIKILNPLSEEHEYLVPSLLPGLIRGILNNWSHHFGSEPLGVRMFELRPVFFPPSSPTIEARGEMDTGVIEKWKLGIAFSGPRYKGGLRNELGEIDFYDLKAAIDALLERMGSRGIRYQPLSESRSSARGGSGGNHPPRISQLFHPGQSVEVLAGNQVAGYFGLLHPAKSREFKARGPIWLAEIDWESLTKFSRKANDVPIYKPWAEFPTMERDFALLVKKQVSAEKLCQVALKWGKPLAKTAKVFDVYRGSQVHEGMTSVAVRVIFYEEKRSLQEPEVEAASAQILEGWKKELGVELRI